MTLRVECRQEEILGLLSVLTAIGAVNARAPTRPMPYRGTFARNKAYHCPLLPVLEASLEQYDVWMLGHCEENRNQMTAPVIYGPFLPRQSILQATADQNHPAAELRQKYLEGRGSGRGFSYANF